MKGGWREVTLGEVFEISSSKRVHQSDWKSSGVPFYRAREIVALANDGYVQNELFISEAQYAEYKEYGVPKPGDLMISAVGTLGACYVVRPGDRFYFKDASVLRFSPKQPVCSDFFRHAFRTREILDQVEAGSGSTVGTYTIARANQTRVSLPPLPEQRRIAEILNKADALRAKRRAALAQLDTLAQSIFLDMFGDPARNPKGWPVRTFEETMRDETSKAEKLQRSDYLPEGRFPVVDQGQSVIAGYCDDERYLCPSELPVVLFGDHTRAVKLVRHRFVVGADGAKVLAPEPGVDAVYLSYMMRELPIPDLGYSRHMRELKRLAFPIPPGARQQEFARRIANNEMHCKAHDRSRLALDSLFAVLQHRAFRGEI